MSRSGWAGAGSPAGVRAGRVSAHPGDGPAQAIYGWEWWAAANHRGGHARWERTGAQRHDAAYAAARRAGQPRTDQPRSERHRYSPVRHVMTYRTAVLRAFSLDSSITQRDAVSRHGPYRPSTRCGMVGLESPSGEVHVGAMNEWPGRG